MITPLNQNKTVRRRIGLLLLMGVAAGFIGISATDADTGPVQARHRSENQFQEPHQCVIYYNPANHVGGSGIRNPNNCILIADPNQPF